MAYRQFYNYLPDNLDVIVEVGTCGGAEAIDFEMNYQDAIVYTFEADPNKFVKLRKTLLNHKRVRFMENGLGHTNEWKEFFRHKSCRGCNSFFDRYKEGDMESIGIVPIRRLDNFGIKKIDLLAMDCQGSEMDVLTGAGDIPIKYIILEMPSGKNQQHIHFEHDVPEGIDSVYKNAPSNEEILRIMDAKGYRIIATHPENMIEDNVLFVKST